MIAHDCPRCSGTGRVTLPPALLRAHAACVAIAKRGEMITTAALFRELEGEYLQKTAAQLVYRLEDRGVLVRVRRTRATGVGFGRVNAGTFALATPEVLS